MKSRPHFLFIVNSWWGAATIRVGLEEGKADPSPENSRVRDDNFGDHNLMGPVWRLQNQVLNG